MTGYRYREGTGLLVVGPGVAVLFPRGDRATALAVHGRVEAGGRAAQVLQAIAGGSPGGLGELPDFALLTWDDDAVHVVVRGPVDVRVQTEAGAVVVDGRDVVTWREQTVRAPVTCEVGDAGAELPLSAGVVRAAGLVMAVSAGELVPATDVELPDTGGTPPSQGSTGVEPEAVPEPEPEPEAESSPRGEPETEPGPAGELEPEPGPTGEPEQPGPAVVEADGPGLISVVPSATVSGLTLVDGPYTAAEAPHRPTVEPADRPTDAKPGHATPAEPSYDHLWEATQMRSVEDAAVRPEEELDEPTGDSSGPPGLADLVHDGETIGPAALAALRAARGSGLAPAPAPASGGHGVLARVCLSGHSNPPERAHCWICGRSVEGEASRRVRPPLGRIRLATGEVVELDASYVIGRRPKATRVSGEVPRVLAVPSPEGEVSGSHLAVRLEDWHVLATDQSRNGTVLFREGEDPRRLQPNVPMIMRSGDVLDLGDGAVLTFEGLP